MKKWRVRSSAQFERDWRQLPKQALPQAVVELRNIRDHQKRWLVVPSRDLVEYKAKGMVGGKEFWVTFLNPMADVIEWLSFDYRP